MSALGDIETGILAFVNKALRQSYAAGNLDVAILTCLKDLANLNLLVGTETSQTLVADDTTLNYPTNFKKMISLVLIDANSNELTPLIPLRGGHDEYRQLRDNDNSSGDTTHYSEFNEQFFLWRPANQSYTTRIEHFRYHPKGASDINDILFKEEFENAIFFGTTYFESLLIKNAEGSVRWGPTYGAEKQLRRMSMKTDPAIING